MRSTLVCMLMLVVLSLCARAIPLPSSAGGSVPRARIRSFLQRRAPGPGGLNRYGYQALNDVEKDKEDWKRPIAIATSAIGLLMTFGWNYVAVQSFMANRQRHGAEETRLRAEKNKPPPQVGDILCTVATYYTQDQVEHRKPSSVAMPCYRLGAAGQTEVSPSVAPTESAIPPARGGVPPVAQPMRGLPPASYPTSAGQAPPVIKRGLGNEGEIVEEVKPVLEDLRSSQASSSPWFEPQTDRHASASEWIPLTPLERSQDELSRYHEEGMPLPSSLPSIRSDPWRSDPWRSDPWRSDPWRSDPWNSGTARLRPGSSQLHTAPSPVHEDNGGETRLADMHDQERAGAEWLRQNSKQWKETRDNKKKRLKTEDITFGITVLNTVGTIPSFALTVANAYLYRGNPKVD